MSGHWCTRRDRVRSMINARTVRSDRSHRPGALAPRLHALLLAAASLPLLLVNLVDVPGNRLWYDELQSITQATRPWPALFPSVIIWDAHGPVSYALLKIWSSAGR